MALTPYPWLDEVSHSLLALKSKLPNAILLYGPSGLGTLTLARQWAKSLLCETPTPDGGPCGTCSSCALVDAHTHPDLKYVVSEWVADRDGLPYTPPENASNKVKLSRGILIHQFRVLQEFLSMSSNQGGRRVILVYPADQIGQEAAASFLKAIEEPPEGLVYILVADDIDKVLPTIRSRSRLVRVSMPDNAQTHAWLQTQAPFNKDKTGQEARRQLALAGGMPLDAMGLTNAYALSKKEQTALIELLLQSKTLPPAGLLDLPYKDLTLPAVVDQVLRFVIDLRLVKAGLPARYFVDYQDAMHAFVKDVPAMALDKLYKALMPISRTREHPYNSRQAIEGIFLTIRDHLRA